MLVAMFPGCRAGDPRGIVLVSADTLGADHLGAYGYGPGTSPNIDHWAGEAIVFRNAFAQLPGTLPSHMSMMTGLTPKQHGVYPSRNVPVSLSPTIPTLAEKLQQAGYRTAGFTEGGYVAGVYGFERGFDEYNYRFRCWTDVLEAAGEYIDSLDPDEPFFLFLHTYDVHDPYSPPEADRSRFDPPPGPLSIEPKGSDLIKVNRGKLAVTPEDVDQLRAMYDAEISFFDSQFPMLLELLGRRNIAGRTMLVFTADHGEEFMEHGRLAHETIYNPAIHVPLIIDVPGWQGRRDVQAMVELTDLPATILSWAGITAADIPGSDLLALAGAAADPDVSFAGSESYIDPHRVVAGRIDGRRLKLVEVTAKRTGLVRRHLFDLDADPLETNDIADLEPGLVRLLAEELDRRKELDVLVDKPELVIYNERQRERLRALGYLE